MSITILILQVYYFIVLSGVQSEFDYVSCLLQVRKGLSSANPSSIGWDLTTVINST